MKWAESQKKKDESQAVEEQNDEKVEDAPET